MRSKVLLTIVIALIIATTSPAVAQDAKRWGFNDFESWEWDVQNPAAQWAPRAGLQAVKVGKRLFVMGGRTPLDPALVPVPGASVLWGDVWASDSPWNAGGPEDIKYDFDALVVNGSGRGWQPTILTFGGDRETFNFFDPFNYLNVDNDVWKFVAPRN